MNFSNDKAIYLQIADRLADEILSGTYQAEERIPSVRDYAVLLQVNTNTAVKSFELLAAEGVIYNKRGLGYFVSADARRRIRTSRRNDFLRSWLPEMFRHMDMLGIGIDDVREQWDKHCREKA